MYACYYCLLCVCVIDAICVYVCMVSIGVNCIGSVWVVNVFIDGAAIIFMRLVLVGVTCLLCVLLSCLYCVYLCSVVMCYLRVSLLCI